MNGVWAWLAEDVTVGEDRRIVSVHNILRGHRPFVVPMPYRFTPSFIVCGHGEPGSQHRLEIVIEMGGAKGPKDVTPFVTPPSGEFEVVLRLPELTVIESLDVSFHLLVDDVLSLSVPLALRDGK